MEFRNYTDKDYEAICDFLIALNQNDKNHINWNWARLEWMMEHPEFDQSLKGSIGLWWDNDRVIGAAIYDMYFGEAFCAVLPGYDALYTELLDYAYHELKDENGLGIAICDDNTQEIEAAENAGFKRADQSETIMRLDLDQLLTAKLPDTLRIEELDPAREPYAFQWLLWQGFDHGTDKAEFEREDQIIPRVRRHFDPALSLTAVNSEGENVAYCCLWYSDKTEYTYVEPVCTVPSYRGKGVAKALICEALRRAKDLGTKTAYVISDTEFYKKLGFGIDKHYTFYWKN